MRRHPRTRTALASMLALAATVAALAPAARADATVVLNPPPPTPPGSGQPITLTGQLTGASGPATVTLLASPYPYGAAAPVASAPARSDGTFAFTVTPDRDTRYTAELPGGPASAAVEVDVAARTITKVRPLPLGRAEVTILVFHPRDLRWTGATVRWSFASPSTVAFRPTRATRTRSLGPFVTVLRTIVALPAGRFGFRACFGAPDDRALLDPEQVPGCAGRAYAGTGTLPAGFPDAVAIGRARGYLAGRIGRKAFAVVDTEGRVAGWHVHWTFPTASVVKAMLLVAYLRRLAALGQRQVDPASNAFLYPMIHVSDNNAATQCWSIVGDGGLYAVAGAARMVDFSVSGLWGTALLSPYDQARFFFRMDALIPPRFVGYARFLLSTIEPSQSWAIPAVARPLGYRVFFKDGSQPTGLGQLVHQVARLEGHRQTFTLAVMTDGDPTMQYGIDTIGGVAAALLRR